jgi:hypothetical protein
VSPFPSGLILTRGAKSLGAKLAGCLPHQGLLEAPILTDGAKMRNLIITSAAKSPNK